MIGTMAIGAGVPTSEIRELATENGFIPLVENALEKVQLTKIRPLPASECVGGT